MKVLITGATGYVGGRLLERLLDRDVDLRVLVRDADRAKARSWSDQVEVVEADLLDRASLARALEGVDVAYYLVHSMCTGDDFAEVDRRARKTAACGASTTRVRTSRTTPSLSTSSTFGSGAPFSSLGGERGWRVWGWAWGLRGALDQLVGGPGLRRGRRDPDVLYPGEALDFWRVEEYRPHSLLRLRAEMKVPGRAWLQFEALSEESGTRLVQTAFFAPTGFLGWLYWYGIYPFHALIFSDMVDAIAADAETLAAGETGPAEASPPGSPVQTSLTVV